MNRREFFRRSRAAKRGWRTRRARNTEVAESLRRIFGQSDDFEAQDVPDTLGRSIVIPFVFEEGRGVKERRLNRRATA